MRYSPIRSATYKLVRTPPRRRGIERWEAAGARARPISCWSIDDDDDYYYYYYYHYDDSSGAKVGVRRPPARSCTIISTKTLYTMSCALLASLWDAALHDVVHIE
uniref:Uncharacterized protein n=1 Tax=Trichogramma kaykai TaxID=54128 RepID=A0ABD2X9B0_9HYME